VRIYTRTGDEGETSLFGGGRVPKGHVRVEAFGTVDELNAVLGLSIAFMEDEGVRAMLSRIQTDLFTLGASLATPGSEDGTSRVETPLLPGERVGEMEGWIDAASEELPPLRSFILPGGTRGAAFLHHARTVCRRAERSVVRLKEAEGIDSVVLEYLNRLSDLLFMMARVENHRQGTQDVPWRGRDP